MSTVTPDEARDLVSKWFFFWKYKWDKIRELSKSKMVANPNYNKDIGGMTVSLSDRGLEFTWEKQYIQLEKLINEPKFKLKDLADVRMFVEETIENAHRDIESAVVERQRAFEEIFEPFRTAAAQWTLEENKRNQKKY